MLATTLPVMGQLAYQLDVKAWAKRIIRGGRVIEGAANELGIGVDELADQAGATDARTELLGRVIRAAGDAVTLEAKIPALTKVLANGLRDEAKIDEAVTFVKALKEMEASHFRGLAGLFEMWRTRRDDGWASRPDLRRITGQRLDDGIMTVLVSNGACTRRTYTDEDYPGEFPMWQITMFGIECLELLEYEPAVKYRKDGSGVKEFTSLADFLDG